MHTKKSFTLISGKVAACDVLIFLLIDMHIWESLVSTIARSLLTFVNNLFKLKHFRELKQ